jgi:glucokinase
MSELYASIDLGGTNVSGVLAAADGRPVAEKQVPTQSHEGPSGVLARIAALVEDLAAQAGRRPAALGMGVPGLADLRRGITKFLPNLPTQWRDVPVGETLSKKLGLPVFLLNDVRMHTLGELVFGHGRTARTFAFFALGTGVGGGIVVDGKLRLGPVGAAGELGHQTVATDGPLCGCGNRGCLETYASGPAIAAEGVRLLRSGLAPRLHERVGGDAGKVTTREMAAAAEAGDANVREAIIRAAELLAVGVSNVIVTLHPDLVVLGGGVAEMGAVLLDPVRRAVERRVKVMPVDIVRIEPSALGPRAGALGGIALAMRSGQVD